MGADRGEEGYIAVTGGRVWYAVAGTGPGAPLLALHGGPGGNAQTLAPLLALGDERPVILYDQLGSGRSDRPDDAALWTLPRFVEELGQVRAALGLPRVHLLGNSWGSLLAAAYALGQPQGLLSLVLSGPWLSVPRFVEDVALLKRQLPQALQAAITRCEAAGTVDTAAYREPAYRAAEREWLHRYMCRDARARAQMRAAFEEPGTGFNAQVYTTMQGPSEFSVTGNLREVDLSSRLHELALPVLLTCGRYDEMTPRTAAWYQSLIPRAELAVFEESAHMAHYEEPELYLQTVRGFLRRVEDETPAAPSAPLAPAGKG
jgi:proline iminopeptidase